MSTRFTHGHENVTVSVLDVTSTMEFLTQTSQPSETMQANETTPERLLSEGVTQTLQPTSETSQQELVSNITRSSTAKPPRIKTSNANLTLTTESSDETTSIIKPSTTPWVAFPGNTTSRGRTTEPVKIRTSSFAVKSTNNASTLGWLTTQSEQSGGWTATTQSDVPAGGRVKLVIIGGVAALGLLFIVLMVVLVICVCKRRRRRKQDRTPDGEFGLDMKVLKVRSSFTFAQQSFADLRSPSLGPDPTGSTELSLDRKRHTSQNFDKLLSKYHLEPEMFSGPESPPVYLTDMESSLEELRDRRSQHGSASNLCGNATSDDVKYSTFKRSAKPSDMAAFSTEMTF